jgi:hypothetical protein
MGLTYYSRSGWSFPVNSCGADLLGHVHRLAGAALSPRSVALLDNYPRAVYVANGEECQANAAKITALTDEQIAALLEKPAVWECWQQPADEFVRWVRSWQAFLAVCGGYDTDAEWTPPNGQEWKYWEVDR